ncbi:extracellular ribonuclease LE precursor, putative [Entamoeba invadens IP1]|uniref:Extracellular ribonuclease LE, putative n=1 Tax=Entamoeba invadens IP1 TaxID=370355 RepID=A0A0A1UCE9_ENTIV|nr:extracellular ribonuclease LE precursor, putative [Entamoeba invadens IP1]ELP92927.1 extracellular ribonuclease LE precursor, putative [Entamoeba invadens IP1]|eukprot:XP_004259698.1 extracellular ribonuclease LE precursor, putative [Entamoeba invadens IP1]
MLFLITTLLFSAYADCSHGQFELCTSNNCKVTWDFVLLVTTWPGYFCSTKCCDSPTRLNGVMTDGFTMHGWWPSFSSGSMPACCTYATNRTNVKSTVEADNDFLDEVAYSWPSLSNCEFFLYEYDKHGVCLTNIYKGVEGPKQYGRAAMKLLKTADAWTVFKAAGAVADGKTAINKQTLLNALGKQIGVTNAAYFRCSGDYVSELRYCTSVQSFDIDNPYFQECTSKVLSKDNCGSSVIFMKELSLTPSGCGY